jgi:hypothetical protein
MFIGKKFSMQFYLYLIIFTLGMFIIFIGTYMAVVVNGLFVHYLLHFVSVGLGFILKILYDEVRRNLK